MTWRPFCFLLFSICLLAACPSFSSADDRVEFNRDVRPILSDKCFFCHGPDANKREADLRLDVREAAIDGGAIAEGSPEGSELLRRVLSNDPNEMMPPPSSKLNKLTSQEFETLSRWIEQGAEYQQHWAFVPIKDIETSSRTVQERSATIDRIVKEGLAQRKLTLQPSADSATLVRRLSFDLIGLPPTLEEVTQYTQDTSPQAYENLVDRLLASPHYGERMAVDWLDVSRYADSYGFQVDRPRDVWPWRDWVIRAFNQNLPFDQFATWQLAGDLMPDATDDQVLATAFNRLHQQEAEGGSVEEEYRVEYVCDRVQTFATAFLGLTFECARCHDHKFDPISQKEYYQFFSMFQNIDEAGLYSYFTSSPPTPTLALADQSAKQRLAESLAKVAELENQSEAIQAACRESFEKWLTQTAIDVEQEEAKTVPNELARFSFDHLENNTLANSIDAAKPATLNGENKLVPGFSGSAIEFTGDDPVNLTLGNFKREEPFSVSLWLKTPDVKERAVVFHRSRAWTDAASRGYELLIEEGRLKWSLIHFWPGNAISIRAEDTLPLDQWIHVVVSYDGSSRADGLAIHVDGQSAKSKVIRDRLTKEITGGGGDEIALGERFRDRGFKQGMIDDFRVFGRELSALDVHAVWKNLSANELRSNWIKSTIDDKQKQSLFEFYLATVDARWSSHLEQLRTARAAYYKAQDGLTEMMVMREMDEPKKSYVLFRGEYGEQREEVFAGTPAALPPLPENAAKNRLGLAQWLFDPQHPLTARVTVNRVWQSIFGRGLVKTAEDFGSQGERPMYPEVLDSLAAGFIASGWDMKQLVKTIVMTETYRQRSVADMATMENDPDNQWLARGPRYRLPAEMIRDNSLVAAGLLKRDLGGPPVNPYEMSESFKPEAPSGNGGVYRRSLYTNWRRTGPPPAMVAFDAPRRAVCTAKREQTDSPLQALILLNGVQYVEAARALGESLHRDAGGDVTKMIENGFLRCLSRRPEAREVEILRALYGEQFEHYTQHTADAERFLKIGNHVRDASIPVPALAAATVLAQTLLNHDACVVKR